MAFPDTQGKALKLLEDLLTETDDRNLPVFFKKNVHIANLCSFFGGFTSLLARKQLQAHFNLICLI